MLATNWHLSAATTAPKKSPPRTKQKAKSGPARESPPPGNDPLSGPRHRYPPLNPTHHNLFFFLLVCPHHHQHPPGQPSGPQVPAFCHPLSVHGMCMHVCVCVSVSRSLCPLTPNGHIQSYASLCLFFFYSASMLFPLPLLGPLSRIGHGPLLFHFANATTPSLRPLHHHRGKLRD